MIRIKEINDWNKKPSLYEKGSHIMWTDPYIQPFLLETHLDHHIDAASRVTSDIESTIDWVLMHRKKTLDVLDLGCGPGLYAQRFAQRGHHVTGIDFSTLSIDYATHKADETNLNIQYINGDYLTTDFKGLYDVIYLIYCDFGVLSFEDQQSLLEKIYQHLKPDGYFIFDGYNEHFAQRIKETSSYEVNEAGFWKPHSHMVLNQTYLYQEASAFLEQHIVIDHEVSCYRFYNHWYKEKEVFQRLSELGFKEIICKSDLIKDKGVTFFKAFK